MLKLQFSDHLHAPVWAMEKSFSIGRDKSNNLVIDSESVSANHAKIIQRNNVFTLKDMGSKAGTFVNDARITHKNIVCGDKLRFGDISLRVVDPFEHNPDGYWSLIADSSFLSGQEFPLTFSSTKPSIIIGRSKECDLIIAGTHLSKQHARLSLGENNHVTIQDLNSTNGTFLNGKKAIEAIAKAGDHLRFDVYSFRLFGPGIDLPDASITQPEMNTLLDETSDSNNNGNKFWKTGPTSPGNREETDYNKRSVLGTVVGIWMVAALGAFIAYLVWALIQ